MCVENLILEGVDKIAYETCVVGKHEKRLVGHRRILLLSRQAGTYKPYGSCELVGNMFHLFSVKAAQNQATFLNACVHMLIITLF